MGTTEVASDRLQHVLHTAVTNAYGQMPGGTQVKSAAIGANNGKIWIAALRKAFQASYVSGEQVQALANEYQPTGQLHFLPCNELLYDITVVRCGTSAPLEVLWQVESEITHSRSAIQFDMTKLALGCAAHKLFITYHPSGQPSGLSLNDLTNYARLVGGSIFIATINDYSTASERKPPMLHLYKRQEDGSFDKLWSYPP